ncbi:MAG: peroxiredoxin family protein [Actinomycetota bacterium]
MSEKSVTPPKGHPTPKQRAGSAPPSRNPYAIAIAIGFVVLAGAYFLTRSGGDQGPSTEASTATGGSSEYPFAVGSPGPGAMAPGFSLASTDGGKWSLAERKGSTVLLYFQEGVMCQPCWDQLTDIEADWPKFKALGIDEVATITVDDLDALKQKAQIEGLATPLLSDPDLGASKAYEANKYGMMGESTDGHSFVLIGPDGAIVWRADYGGAPKYTMYLPVDQLITDMKAGRVG